MENAARPGPPPDRGSRLHPGATLLDLFWDDVRLLEHGVALRYRAGAGWETITWGQYGQAVRAVAAGLMTRGIGPAEQVAIWSARRRVGAARDADLVDEPYAA